MSFIDLAKKRYSVRKFAKQLVEQEKIDIILEAARVAPTACNYQPQRILVIQSERSLVKVDECTPYRFNAPLVFLICYDKPSCWINWSDEEAGIVDASIVVTQMMLVAEDIGLGSTWLGAFDFAKTRELFEVPDYLEIVAYLTVGYPAVDATPSHQHLKRFALETTTFYDDFSGIKPGKPSTREY
jgi:nitroreductase